MVGLLVCYMFSKVFHNWENDTYAHGVYGPVEEADSQAVLAILTVLAEWCAIEETEHSSAWIGGRKLQKDEQMA